MFGYKNENKGGNAGDFKKSNCRHICKFRDMIYAHNNELTVSLKRSDYRNNRTVLEEFNDGF